MSSNFTVIYDACVLYPAPLRDLLMRLALTDLIWSPKNGHHKVYYFLTLWRLYEEVNTRPAVHR